ncbi:mannosyl-3-phosphoglycerate phosphatase-related protein [Erwinia endophytica]|uniref:mannosyl-3-phosphoglycerate phosphatase-related protein n=1 Tax=Erwinia endophytica TaxID=1563158 RepID=UPI001265F6AC|nr:mannosyl-3-phosphoglycerate phosphatase-related protein [Erwinia endophytica]KAB8310721.1 mannosyl-3-phosphoglycerate phosphatase-related protein [Erwinia endophytica]
MPTLQDPLMIVTDLDGSLLDHHTYSWQPAQPWLDRLNAAGIPLIICSSKTAAEIQPIQQSLGITNAPFIAENGAIIMGKNVNETRDALLPAKDYSALCQILQHVRQRYGFEFTGFADVTEKEVADWTGLTPREAVLAKMRKGSESIIWRDSPENFVAFQQALSLEKLALRQGGRFWHVMNQRDGKGTALARLLAHYTHPQGKRWITLGLGDGPNDAPMLDQVNYAVVIKGYSKNRIQLSRDDNENIYYSTGYGPQGWSEGLAHFVHC